AIMLREMNLLKRSVIYATDINSKSIRTAIDGIYPYENIQNHKINYQNSGGLQNFSEYYSVINDTIIFNKELRQHVIFAQHNLAVDPSFGVFQLIICRNVFIYFNPVLQNRVIHLFHNSLSPLGYLALGNKESLLFSEDSSNFVEV